MPNYVPYDDVLRVLRQFPNGATTKQLADVLGMRPASLGGRLSKMFIYGKHALSREFRRHPVAGKEAIWRIV